MERDEVCYKISETAVAGYFAREPKNLVGFALCAASWKYSIGRLVKLTVSI